jgi:D-sedoheptulose 7-phosphate isomerase
MLTRVVATDELTERIAAALRDRTPAVRAFFAQRSDDIAKMALEVAQRLDSGGCIYAFGRGAYATDAQHTAVEFVHPVLVGKPALPASDVSLSFETALPVLVRPGDVAIGFGPPEGDPVVTSALDAAKRRGVYTIAYPGSGTDLTIEAISDDEHVHQEIVEIAGHVFYECVHVFLEHRHLAHDAGASSFLYPFLGGAARSDAEMLAEIGASIEQKGAEAIALRERVAREESANIATVVTAIARAVARGGRVLLFGNGGSATDATDWALDFVQPGDDSAPVPALSLAVEPATITAIANDVGREFIFVRQLIAHARHNDIVIALSTSGGSKNVIDALVEARKRGHETIALLGYDGGEIARRGLADYVVIVRSDYIPRIQEAQGAVYHTIRRALAWVDDAA